MSQEIVDAPKFRIECTDWRRFPRNSLVGFATLRVAELRLTIKGVAIHTNGNRRFWALLPNKPMLDKDHKPILDKQTGKPAYARILEWDNRDVSDAFSERAIAAVLDRDPDAFR
jgi:hypothetical protein